MRTCTVGELKEALEMYDENTPVVASSDYGDRAHTPQAIPILTEEIQKRLKKANK